VVAAPLAAAAATAICIPPRPGQLRRRGGALRADVDGDGRRDLVTIRADPRAPASCGFYLDVATRRGHLQSAVPEGYKPPQDLKVSEWPFADPYVAAIVGLGRRGAQVVVTRWHGAATVDVSIYGVVGGRLRLLRFPPPRDTTLSLFGTVGTGDVHARCRRGGPLIVSGIVPLDQAGHRWRLDRTEYMLSGGRFRVTRRASLTVREVEVPRAARRWRLYAPAFAGCTVARGRRL
jgi:hypothetical protein